MWKEQQNLVWDPNLQKCQGVGIPVQVHFFLPDGLSLEDKER